MVFTFFFRVFWGELPTSNLPFPNQGMEVIQTRRVTSLRTFKKYNWIKFLKFKDFDGNKIVYQYTIVQREKIKMINDVM